MKSLRAQLLNAVPLLGHDLLGNQIIQSQALNAGDSGGLNWWLLVDFSTTDASPLSNPYVGEIGSLNIVENDGTLAAASSLLTYTAQATPVDGDLGFVAAVGKARLGGRGIYFKITPTTLNVYPAIGWNTSGGVPSTSFKAMFRVENPLSVNDTGAVSLARTMSNGTTYEFWIILLSTGALLFAKGGVFTAWTLCWIVLTDTTATLYPFFSSYNGVGNVDFIKGRDLPAPFTDKTLLASVNKASFTQSLGAQLLSNPDFSSAWIAGDPPGWTEYNEIGVDPEITEVAPANTHGGGGTGAANIYSSAAAVGLYQVVLTANKIYEFGFEITARVSGTFGLYPGGSDPQDYAASAVGVYKRIARSKTGGAAYMPYAAGATDFTEDNMSAKEITLNVAQTMPADALIDYTFVLPASPVAGQQISLNYRISASGEELYNCWDAYLQRNASNTAWDFRLDSIAAGTRTNRINVTGVGNVTTIRVICSGNNHDCYTAVAGAWTKRGSTINNSAYATAILANTIASSGFTESALQIYPLTNTAWDVELSKVS